MRVTHMLHKHMDLRTNTHTAFIHTARVRESHTNDTNKRHAHIDFRHSHAIDTRYTLTEHGNRSLAVFCSRVSDTRIVAQPQNLEMV